MFNDTPYCPLSVGGAGAAGRRRRGEQLGLAPRGVGQTALSGRVLSERRQAQTAARGWSASAACCRQTQTAVRHGTTQLCRSRPSETGCWQPRREPVTPAEGPRGGNRAESRTAVSVLGEFHLFCQHRTRRCSTACWPWHSRLRLRPVCRPDGSAVPAGADGEAVRSRLSTAGCSCGVSSVQGWRRRPAPT